MQRLFSDLEDIRLLHRANNILLDLFRNGVHSIRQVMESEADAKGCYRFLQNDRVSEEDLVSNMRTNCLEACKGKFVLCIQDTTEINLSSHSNRINKNDNIGTTNVENTKGLGFFIHPSFVVDAGTGVPYGYADVKLWNRPLEFESKKTRQYNKLSIKAKESYKWIEVSQNTRASLKDVVERMVIIQDREGDIYEQYAIVPDEKTELLIRAKTNRTLVDGTKLFNCLTATAVQSTYEITVSACAKTKRKARIAKIEIKYKQVEIKKTDRTSKGVAPSVKLNYIEATEVGYSGKDKICWKLLTTIDVFSEVIAKMCIDWYSWRWMIEEVFKILKKENYNIEASELEYASSVRKLSLLIMEVAIKLLLMRQAYAEPEEIISADACFTKEEQEYLELQIIKLEGKTAKQKNPFKERDLKRYTWAIARLGGWKGYESKRHPGITTLWIGLKYFMARIEGWRIGKDVSTR